MAESSYLNATCAKKTINDEHKKAPSDQEGAEKTRPVIWHPQDE